jgi:hypothetical protein
MKQYAAVTRNGDTITRVGAVSENDAKDKISKRLNCPGRWADLKRWLGNGAEVIELQ